MESININDVLQELRDLLEIDSDTLTSEIANDLNSAFNMTLLPDANNADDENLKIFIDRSVAKSLRLAEAGKLAINSLEQKIKTFNELKIVYGRQSLNGVTSYLLGKLKGDLLSIKFYFGFLNPLGSTPPPQGVTINLNPDTRKFDFIVEKSKLLNENTLFNVPADNAYTIKPYLKIRSDLPENGEDVKNPKKDSNLDKFYFEFSRALHFIMPIARLYEGDITREVVEEISGQEFKYAWAIAREIVLRFKVKFIYDTQEGRNIDTRQEIVDTFNDLIISNNYGEIGKKINLQDFASLSNVAGVASVTYGWTSSDPNIVANQDFTNSNDILQIPSNVYLTCKINRDDVEIAPL